MVKNKKVIGIAVGVGVFIILLVVSNVSAKKKAAEAARQQEVLDRLNSINVEPTETISQSELEQQSYISVWGEPPTGFRWNSNGDLIPLSDVSMTAEEVSYAYMRALSLLDFSTSEKYSSYSQVVSVYQGYYGSTTSQSYYVQFLRKLYKEVLLSMEINEVKDTAVFANGQRIITFSINVLDLTNKDFWLGDMNEIYSTLYSYTATESDSTKAQQYLYDYLLKYYQSDKATKRTVQVDLVLDKVSLGGWLVSDDSDLNMLCSYENGVNVSEYIMECFSDWVSDGGM